MKKNDTEKLQTSGAYFVTPTGKRVRPVKFTTSVEPDSESQLPQSDYAQYITDSILEFTTLGVELGNALTQRLRNDSLKLPTSY